MNSSNPSPSTSNVQSARSNICLALFFSVLAVPAPALTQGTIAPCYKTVADAEAAAIAATTSTNNCGGGQTLISVDPKANGLFRTDLATFTETGPITITLAGDTVTGGQGIARNPVNGQYYAILKVSSGSRRLVTIDVHTGVATDMGSLGDQFSSITFAPDGRLFGVTGDGATVPETLYQIDPGTAARTLLKELGNGTDGEVICFNPDDDHIYHWSGNSTTYFEKIESDPPYNITSISAEQGVEVFGAVYRGGGVFLIGDIGNHYQTYTTAGAGVIVTNTPGLRRGYALEAGGGLVKTAATVGDCNAVVTVTVTDGCRNTASVVYNTRIDDTPPSATQGSIAACYHTVNEANVAALAATTMLTDNCDPSPSEDVFQSATEACSTSVIIRVSDTCGNHTDYTYNTRVDNTPPMITCALDTTIECPATPTFVDPVPTDACGTVTLTHTDTAIAGNCATPGGKIKYATKRTWTVTDECGNQSTCSQTITVEDNTPPSFTGFPPNTTVECPRSTAPAATGTPGGSDTCGGTTVSFTDATSTPDCTLPGRVKAVITRTWKVTDECGNFITQDQTIQVADTTPPTFMGFPPNAIVECPGDTSPTATGAPTGSDTCSSGTISHTDSETMGACVDQVVKVITRTWKVTDACGNTSTQDQTIIVKDTTPPTFVGFPPNAIVECPGDTSPTATGAPTGSDTCSSGAISHTDSETMTACVDRVVRVITRTWKVTDACGNTSTQDQTITVKDTTPPTIGCPGPVTVQHAADVPAPNPSLVTASDTCAGTVTATHVGDVMSLSNCVSQFTLTRTYRATDGCGNSATCSQTITVKGTTLPTISCPGPVTVQCAADVPAPNPSLVTASDTCAGAVMVTHVSDVLSLSNCVNRFTITRTYRATDTRGNSATCAQTIIVNDTTPPAITCPDDIVISTGGGCTAVDLTDLGTPVVSDNCSDVTVSTNRLDGKTLADPYPVGTTTIQWTATDACGNSSTCNQKVTVTTDKFIAADFNGTAIPGGSTVWFNSNAKVKLNGHCPTKILFSQQTIKSTKFSLAIPDSEINFVEGACPATTIFDGVKWVTTVGCDFTKPVFLSGYAFQVPAAGLPGGIKPVTWSGTLTTDMPGVTLKWSWGAAVYSTFAPDNNLIGVKPVDGNQCTSYLNSDHSGTPENYKPYLIGGARGGGGSNWTGGLSGTQAVAPCSP